MHWTAAARGSRSGRLVCGVALHDDAEQAALAGASGPALVHLRFGTKAEVVQHPAMAAA